MYNFVGQKMGILVSYLPLFLTTGGLLVDDVLKVLTTGQMMFSRS
jgi:hypothetical protein